jgi:hypothetical protein
MRILIDECLPRKLKHELHGHEVATVQEMGWSGVKNGTLLQLMIDKFDVFVTIDGNLDYQQNLSDAAIGVIVFQAPNNKVETLLPLIPAVRTKLNEMKPGTVLKFSTEY